MKRKSVRSFIKFALVFIFLLVIGQIDLSAYGAPPAATLNYGSTRSSLDGTRYSGTDCVIEGTFHAGTAPPPVSPRLTKVELWVGNVRRYVQEWPSGTGPLSHGPITKAFSSTQFTHNSTQTLTAKCWDDQTTGNYAEATQDKIMWNRGYVLYNTSLINYGSTVASYVNTTLGSMNHGTSGVVSTHSSADIRENIPNYGLFYIYTHGSETEFQDCPDSDVVTNTQVETAVGTKTNGQCPYTFVFLDACDCGNTNTSGQNSVALLCWHGKTLVTTI